METTYIATVEATTDVKKYYAALNASTNNAVLKTTFSSKAQLLLQRAETVLSMFHYNSKTKINYRKTLASIKLFNKNVSNYKELQKYEAYLSDLGFVKKVSPQGIVYSINKNALAA